MARKPTETQEDATQPRPMSADGWVLDEHGLPISGPARAEVLKGQPDPAQAAPAPDAQQEG